LRDDHIDAIDARQTHSGDALLGSALVRDPKFQALVVAETRAMLSTIPK
jgi:hypothetical protein